MNNLLGTLYYIITYLHSRGKILYIHGKSYNSDVYNFLIIIIIFCEKSLQFYYLSLIYHKKQNQICYKQDLHNNSHFFQFIF